MKKQTIAAFLVAISPLCQAQSVDCESLIRGWAKLKAYDTLCKAQTGLEDEFNAAQMQCAYIGEAKAAQYMAPEFEYARSQTARSHARYCAKSRSEFEQIRESRN